MKLEKTVQYNNKFPLSIFDKSTPGNVRFEEYQDLDLPICVELVLRAKQNTAKASTPQPFPTQSAYSYGNAVGPTAPPPIPPQYMQNMRNGAPPTLPQLPPQLDAASIQRLLGHLPPPTPSQQQYPNLNPSPQHQQQQSGQPPLPTAADLARLLASASAAQTPQPHQNQPYGVPPLPLPLSHSSQPSAGSTQNGANAYQALLSNPALAALLKGSAQQTPQQGQATQYQQYHGQQQQQNGQQYYQQQQQQQHSSGAGAGHQGAQPDMQNIMAKLARYG